MSVVVDFHCGVIGCQLARRGMRHGADGANCSGGGVQGVWAWLRGQSDLDLRLRAVFLVSTINFTL